MLRILTPDPEPPKQVGLIRASVYTAAIVEDLACRDAMREELVTRSLDVRRRSGMNPVLNPARPQ
jgi:hypothetical protein